MGKNRKAALELATTPPHVPGANYAPARSPGRMVTARMSAPRPAEERESSSSASYDDGENREPLPSHAPSHQEQQQQQHIAAVEPISCPALAPEAAAATHTSPPLPVPVHGSLAPPMHYAHAQHVPPQYPEAQGTTLAHAAR